MVDESPAANVVVALNRVLRDLPGIGKGGRADARQGGYAYRGIEQITREAGPLFAKHGVVFVPKVLSWERDEITVADKPWTDDRMTILYTVYGPGGTGDCIEVGPIPAVGRDNSDKGTNKALTQAFKYALLQVLCIADDKDDADGTTAERDAGTSRRTAPPPRAAGGPRPATDKQRGAIERMVNTTGEMPVIDGGTVWPLPDDLTMQQASTVIDQLKGAEKEPKATRVSTLRSDDAPGEELPDGSEPF